MNDALRHSEYTLRHAQRRLDEFKREVLIFRDKSPFKIIPEFNPETGKDDHKIRSVEAVPDLLAGCAFDVIVNLRAALDQAGYATAIAAAPNKGRDAHFPFGLTPAEVQSRKNGRSKDIPPEIFDVMVACNPYKGGNDLLWNLNHLCNTNKHETILHTGIGTFSTGRNFTPGFPIYNRTKNEIIVGTTRHGAELQGYIEIPVFIAVGDGETIPRIPATTMLSELRDIVERILMAIEGEGLRLRLFR